MRSRPGQRERRAVLGPVKAWPGDGRARGKASAAASLDGPLRAARGQLQAGTKEQLHGTNKGTAQNEEAPDGVANVPYPPRSARG